MNFHELLDKRYDRVEKYLFNEWVMVEKTNSCGLWKNKRQIKISDGQIMNAYINVQNPKMQVQLINCNHIGYELQNDNVFILKFLFQERYCQNIHNNYLSPNSTKLLTWEFIIKDQNILQYIKSKIYEYETKWFLAYIQTYKCGEYIKYEFYSLFSKYCIEQTNNFIKMQYIKKDLKIEKFKGDQKCSLRNYKRISNLLRQLEYDYNCHIVPHLICIVMIGSESYQCTLIMNDKRQQNNQKIEAEILRISDSNGNFQQLLQFFDIQYFECKNKLQYALLIDNQSNFIVQMAPIDDKISKLNRLEIYDQQQLSSELHQNEISIRQIGSILKHEKLKHQDLQKLIKAEIIARSLKTLFKKQSLKAEKALIQELIKSFIPKNEIELKYPELKNVIKEKFNITYDDLNKSTTNEILLLNSLMNQLNFFIPLEIKKLLNQVSIKDSLVFDKIELKTKCKTYIQDFDTYKEPPDSCLNYKYLESIKEECLENRLKYLNLAKYYLGDRNSLIVKFQFQCKSDNQSLKKALEMLKQLQPESTLIKDLEREINGLSNSEETIKHSDILFREKCIQEENAQQKKIIEIYYLILEELPSDLKITKADDELAKMKDKDIFNYAEIKYKKGLYDQTLKILDALRSKYNKEILLLGFKSEKQMQNLKQNIYSISLLNYLLIFGLQDQSDIKTIEEIFWFQINHFIWNYLKFDKDYYKKICVECPLKIDQQNFMLEMYQFWKHYQIENLKEYSALQFDVLNENKNYISQNIQNQLKDPLLHAVKFIKNISTQIKF